MIGLTSFKYEGAEISVRVLAPVQVGPDGDEFSCSFQIEGGSIHHHGEARGLDSMQALILALTKIGTFLQLNDKIDLAAVEWPNGKLEFPVFSRLA